MSASTRSSIPSRSVGIGSLPGHASWARLHSTLRRAIRRRGCGRSPDPPASPSRFSSPSLFLTLDFRDGERRAPAVGNCCRCAAHSGAPLTSPIPPAVPVVHTSPPPHDTIGDAVIWQWADTAEARGTNVVQVVDDGEPTFSSTYPAAHHPGTFQHCFDTPGVYHYRIVRPDGPQGKTSACTGERRIKAKRQDKSRGWWVPEGRRRSRTGTSLTPPRFPLLLKCLRTPLHHLPKSLSSRCPRSRA